MAHEEQRKRDAIYRGIASEKPLSLPDAVSTAVGRYRPVTFPLGIFQATAASSAARTHGTPIAPSAVNRGRSSAHVHAFLMYAPLDFVDRTRAHQHTCNSKLFILPLSRGLEECAICLAGYSPPRANTNFQRGGSREVS